MAGSRRSAAGALVAMLAASAVWVAGTPPPAAAAPPAGQRLAMLLQDHVAHSRPDARAGAIETVSARRPLTGVPTVLPVLGAQTGRDGRAWIRVRLPGRPNGHDGWILREQTRRTGTEWQLTLDLSSRRVTAYRDGRVERRFRVVVGKPSTPTPTGRFFVEEVVALSPTDSGAPFALATSARSQVLQEFAGGPGQIALHATTHLSGGLGSASSHGCVRLAPAAIRWLARRIGSGVPLVITR